MAIPYGATIRITTEDTLSGALARIITALGVADMAVARLTKHIAEFDRIGRAALGAGGMWAVRIRASRTISSERGAGESKTRGNGVISINGDI